jgi:hypothetical protein
MLDDKRLSSSNLSSLQRELVCRSVTEKLLTLSPLLAEAPMWYQKSPVLLILLLVATTGIYSTLNPWWTEPHIWQQTYYGYCQYNIWLWFSLVSDPKFRKVIQLAKTVTSHRIVTQLQVNCWIWILKCTRKNLPIVDEGNRHFLYLLFWWWCNSEENAIVEYSFVKCSSSIRCFGSCLLLVTCTRWG